MPLVSANPSKWHVHRGHDWEPLALYLDTLLCLSGAPRRNVSIGMVGYDRWHAQAARLSMARYFRSAEVGEA
jgi:hypothetical protein